MMAANKANEQDVVVVDEGGEQCEDAQAVAKITGNKREAAAAAGDDGVASSKKTKTGEKVHSAPAPAVLAQGMDAVLRWVAGELAREHIEKGPCDAIEGEGVSLRTVVGIRSVCRAWRDVVDSWWSPADLLEHQLRREQRGISRPPSTGPAVPSSDAEWAQTLDPVWAVAAMTWSGASIQARGAQAVERLCARVAAAPAVEIGWAGGAVLAEADGDAEDVGDALFKASGGNPHVIAPYIAAINRSASPYAANWLMQSLAIAAVGRWASPMNAQAARALVSAGGKIDAALFDHCTTLLMMGHPTEMAAIAAVDRDLGILDASQRRALMSTACDLGGRVLNTGRGGGIAGALECAEVLMRAGWEFTDTALVSGLHASPEHFFGWLGTARPVLRVIGGKALDVPLDVPYPPHVSALFNDDMRRAGVLAGVFAAQDSGA